MASSQAPIRIPRTLNKEAVPGPGSGIWYDATNRGRPTRTEGLLRNETYIGRLVWNRLQPTKDPMTGKRVRRSTGVSDVVVDDRLELRIIEQPLWERVQAHLMGRVPSGGVGTCLPFRRSPR